MVGRNCSHSTFEIIEMIYKIVAFFQFWKAYIKRPMVLVGPSLGGAAAIDFAVAHPEAVCYLPKPQVLLPKNLKSTRCRCNDYFICCSLPFLGSCEP